MYLGQIDRQLSMLIKAGHLKGIAGVVLGQFTNIEPSGSLSIIDLVGEHLLPWGVPILGGMPLGHGSDAKRLPMGRPTILDSDMGMLKVQPL